jgi:hypothetical protein
LDLEVRFFGVWVLFGLFFRSLGLGFGFLGPEEGPKSSIRDLNQGPEDPEKRGLKGTETGGKRPESVQKLPKKNH